jgi:hypothetical protein
VIDMSLEQILVLIAGLTVIVGFPLFMAWSAIDYVRGRHRRRERPGGGAVMFGAALQELDRIVARPSVEHVVEAETPVLRREDESGGQ